MKHIEWTNPIKTVRNFIRGCAVWGGMAMFITGAAGSGKATLEEYVLDKGRASKVAKEAFYKLKRNEQLTSKEAHYLAQSYENNHLMKQSVLGVVLGLTLIFVGAAEKTPQNKPKPNKTPASKTNVVFEPLPNKKDDEKEGKKKKQTPQAGV